MKRCYKCELEKNSTEFSKDKTKKDGLCTKCKSCAKTYRLTNVHLYKKYRLENKEKTNKYQTEYRFKNLEKIREYNKQYNFNRIKSDVFFKLSHSIRVRIRDSFKRGGWKKSGNTEKLLGCDYKTFKAHLEKQFTKGMNWYNYGEWHLDHIYPVSLARNEKHLIELNHYTNFQPLWKKDNISKGNKIIEKQLFLI